jgi:DNA-binding LacI/PurR family transcriptional regulator
MAIGTILAARDFGLRVPQDLSVIGIDGHELGEVFGLTTIDQDARGQGALAVRRLLAGLDGGSDSADPDTEYPTRFVVRSSTAVPPVDQGPLR